MIVKEKEIAAIKALQSVIVRGRAMAYEKANHRSIADLLDRAEYLAAMLYNPNDMKDSFLSNLVELASLHGCSIALSVFETDS